MVRQNGHFRWVGPWGGRGISALALAAAIAASLGGQSVHAQCQYEVTAIITPDDAESCWPFPPSNTFARGMNEKGEVVGYYKPCAIGNERAFFWSEETGFVTLPTPTGVSQAFASDINDHGIIIGQHVFTGVGGKGYVYDPKTEGYTYLEPLHEGATHSHLTVANAINNNGFVAGARVISKPGEPIISNAVIWDTNTGEVTDLGVKNGPSSVAEDINEHGDAAGWTGNSSTSPTALATLWIEGQIIELGVLPRAIQSSSRGINNLLTVVGTSRIPNVDGGGSPAHGFLWSGSDLVHLLPEPPYERFSPNAVSDGGQVVGALVTSSSTVHASVWQHDKFHNLNELAVRPPLNLNMESGVSVQDSSGLILVHTSLGANAVGVLLMPIESSAADLNFDCKVNVHDLLQLILYHWGDGPASKADLNEDGIVDVFDVLTLLANWG